MVSVPKYQLFLGYPIDLSLANSILHVDDGLKNYFIRDDDLYLCKIAHRNGVEYLGKFVGERTDLHALETIEANVYSLLSKILPDYPFQQTALRLFPASGKS